MNAFWRFVSRPVPVVLAALIVVLFAAAGSAQNAAERRLSFDEAETQAKQGDAEAQNQLGLLHAAGRRGTTNYTEAFKWFREAANQGHANGQTNLANFYLKGVGVPQNYLEAFKWYQKAAEQGNVGAQQLLAWMYANGKGVEQNFKEALKWHLKAYQKVAEQGDKDAQLNLGLLYLRRDNFDPDLTPDYVEAYKWISLAATHGNTNALKYRAQVSLSMTPEQLAEGQRRALEFNSKKPTPEPAKEDAPKPL
jgi:TPR repeat protein